MEKIVWMPTEYVNYISHVELGMCKRSARWVPRLLNADHKRERA